MLKLLYPDYISLENPRENLQLLNCMKSTLKCMPDRHMEKTCPFWFCMLVVKNIWYLSLAGLENRCPTHSSFFLSPSVLDEGFKVSPFGLTWTRRANPSESAISADRGEQSSSSNYLAMFSSIVHLFLPKLRTLSLLLASRFRIFLF